MVDNKCITKLISTPFCDTYIPQHQLGPDYIIPTDDTCSSKVDGAIHIDPHKETDPRFKPISVITFFRTAVENSPNKLALVGKCNDVILKWTYLEYYEAVKNVAKGFIKLGLTPFHTVAILGYNSPEWMISYAAAIFCGAIATGIYTTNSPEACLHIIENSSAVIVIVDKKEQLDKILSIRHKLPQLKAIIQYGDSLQHPDIILWQDLIPIGLSIPDEILEKRIRGIAINQCCTIIYTSGTTGQAKGVIISHDNIIFMIKSGFYSSMNGSKYGSIVSYLPLSHIAALGMDFYLPLLTESTVYFAHPDALKGRLIEDLTQIQPTYFMSVPRIFEKFKEKLQTVEESLPKIKKKLIKWACKQALAYNQQVVRSTSEPIRYLAAKTLILNKVKKAMGLQKVECFLCGGASISPEVIQFFQSYDILLQELYGCSESSGAHIVANPKQHYCLGSVGNVQTQTGIEIKISNPNSCGSGEILLSGRNICIGYLGEEEATKDALKETKWLHTGDLGVIDNDGFLFVTGRLKELIITSGGENIAPVPIEDKIKKLLPVISNCMLIGESRKYLTILLTLKTETDLSTMEPTDELDPTAVNWCQSVGSTALSVSQILQTVDSNVKTGIQNGIDEYNEKHAVSRAQKIQKWTILPQDFSIPNGTLGPTAKLRRQIVLKEYHSTIEALYSS